jgi:ubiquinone/menaquinone biosynthesis C-methylase UbiE
VFVVSHSDNQQQLLEIMGRAASGYNRTGPQFFGEVASRLVGLVTLRPYESILDVATGPGVVLCEAARMERSAFLTGTDLAPAMVDEARARLAALGCRADLRVMDAEQLEFADSTFDHVFCASALYQFPDPSGAAREFHRVTRPGGTVAISVFGQADSRWQPKDELIARFAPGLRRVGRPFDGEGLRTLLEAAGYRGISVSQHRFDFLFRDAHEWLATAWSHGERRALEAMAPDDLRAFKEQLPEALSGAEEGDGLLHWRPEVVFATGLRAQTDPD